MTLIRLVLGRRRERRYGHAGRANDRIAAAEPDVKRVGGPISHGGGGLEEDDVRNIALGGGGARLPDARGGEERRLRPLEDLGGVRAVKDDVLGCVAIMASPEVRRAKDTHPSAPLTVVAAHARAVVKEDVVAVHEEERRRAGLDELGVEEGRLARRDKGRVEQRVVVQVRRREEADGRIALVEVVWRRRADEQRGALAGEHDAVTRPVAGVRGGRIKSRRVA